MTSWVEIWEISLFKKIGVSYHENYEEINGFYWLAFWLFIIIYYKRFIMVSPKGIVRLGGLPGITIDNTKPAVLIAPKP
jgi:hypothetical protein